MGTWLRSNRPRGIRATSARGPGTCRSTPLRRAVALLLACLFAASPSLAAAPAATKPRTFSSPEQAVQALVSASRAHDTTALLGILGSGARPLVTSGDDVADREARERFVAAYDEAHQLVKDGNAKVVLDVGKDSWPLPIPLVKDGSGWHFDTNAGQQEILNRRIGKNELSAIQVCLAMVDAEREYWHRNPEKSPLPHYALRIGSTSNRRDGLYWPTTGDETPSPLGELVAEARREGYRKKSDEPVPYHGYYYRILTAQGPSAPGGAYDYLVNGQLIGGFAVVAYPATWGASGVMTFIVNYEGVVYQKNLGPNTSAIAGAMKTYNPDSTWTKEST